MTIDIYYIHLIRLGRTSGTMLQVSALSECKKYLVDWPSQYPFGFGSIADFNGFDFIKRFCIWPITIV